MKPGMATGMGKRLERGHKKGTERPGTERDKARLETPVWGQEDDEEEGSERAQASNSS